LALVGSQSSPLASARARTGGVLRPARRGPRQWGLGGFLRSGGGMLGVGRELAEARRLGRIEVSTLLRALLLFSWGSLVLCYVITVSLGHMPVFLPMISDCFVYAPEKYVSRLAVVTFGGVGMGSSVVIIHIYLRNYSVQAEGVLGAVVSAVNWFSFALGIIGSCGLAGVGAVPENDGDGSLHVALATTFFMCFAFQMLTVTAMLEVQDRFAHPHSRAIKIILLIMEWSFLYGITQIWNGPRTYQAILEWSSALVVFLWMSSLSYEIKAAGMTLELTGLGGSALTRSTEVQGGKRRQGPVEIGRPAQHRVEVPLLLASI